MNTRLYQIMFVSVSTEIKLSIGGSSKNVHFASIIFHWGIYKTQKMVYFQIFGP